LSNKDSFSITKDEQNKPENKSLPTGLQGKDSRSRYSQTSFTNSQIDLNLTSASMNEIAESPKNQTNAPSELQFFSENTFFGQSSKFLPIEQTSLDNPPNIPISRETRTFNSMENKPQPPNKPSTNLTTEMLQPYFDFLWKKQREEFQKQNNMFSKWTKSETQKQEEFRKTIGRRLDLLEDNFNRLVHSIKHDMIDQICISDEATVNQFSQMQTEMRNQFSQFSKSIKSIQFNER